MKYFIEVVCSGDESVCKKLGPLSERSADHVDLGLRINLNHEKFYTRIVPVEAVEQLKGK